MTGAAPRWAQGAAEVSSSAEANNRGGRGGETIADNPGPLQINSPISDAPLAAPIVVAKFWRSPRNRREAVFVSLREYEGHALVDCRIFAGDDSGRSVPTSKGLALSIDKLPQLIRALERARAEAMRLGLITESSSS